MKDFISNFIRWVRANESRLAADKIRVNMPSQAAKEGTYAEFFSQEGEATVELWDYGFSEFHVWLHRSGSLQEEVKTTHHEFQDFDEMNAALDNLVNRMNGNDNSPVSLRKWTSEGHMETIQIERPFDAVVPVPNTKGKSR